MSEKALIYGGTGGREFELGRALRTEDVEVHFAPGNGMSDTLGTNVQLAPDQVCDYVEANDINLTILGDDQSIACGLGDTLRDRGHPVYGPSKQGGRIETSKIYSARFNKRYSFAQPRWRAFMPSQLDQAVHLARIMQPDRQVWKADGLAKGKGAVLPKTTDEAIDVINDMLVDGGFDGAGLSGIIYQERLHGPEVSLFAITDGNRVTQLSTSQDHKRLLDGDKGPNTGGMGAYAPLPTSLVSDKQLEKMFSITSQTAYYLGRESRGTYQGTIYENYMLAQERQNQPVKLETNARFGDPETQVVIPLAQRAGMSIYDLLRSTAEGRLEQRNLPRDLGECALTVCLASENYPNEPIIGREVHVPEDIENGNLIVHYAGVKRDVNGVLRTSSGRVLYVTGFGKTIDDAAANAYGAIGSQEKPGVHFEGMQYRTDIAHQTRAA